MIGGNPRIGRLPGWGNGVLQSDPGPKDATKACSFAALLRRGNFENFLKFLMEFLSRAV
jgi:hypothetical protein